MGLSHSRTIYDPQNRSLPIQEEGRQRFNVIVSQWKVDDQSRMIAKESCDILGVKSFDPDFKGFYEWLHTLDLKGIDVDDSCYSFDEKH